MEAVLNNDAPPPYSSLVESMQQKSDTIPSAEVVISAGSEPLVAASFANEQARRVFYVKVMSIALLQVLATGFIIGFIHLTWICWDIERNRTNLIFMSSLLHLPVLVALFCCTEARKKPPVNYMFLAALPLTLAFSIVVFTCGVLLREVFIGFIYYGAVTLAQLFYCIFCLDSEQVFKARNGFFITTALLLALYAPVAMWSWYVNPLTLLLVTVIVLLECVSLTYRLHAMTSPDYHCPVHPSDFINGALALHTDTVYILVRAAKSFKSRLPNVFV